MVPECLHFILPASRLQANGHHRDGNLNPDIRALFCGRRGKLLRPLHTVDIEFAIPYPYPSGSCWFP